MESQGRRGHAPAFLFFSPWPFRGWRVAVSRGDPHPAFARLCFRPDPGRCL